jgi:hypothetical protein
LRLLDVLVAFVHPHHQQVDAGGHVFDAVIRPIFSTAAENDAASQKRAYRWLAELFSSSSGNSGNGTSLLLFTADRRAFVLNQLPALGWATVPAPARHWRLALWRAVFFFDLIINILIFILTH